VSAINYLYLITRTRHNQRAQSRHSESASPCTRIHTQARTHARTRIIHTDALARIHEFGTYYAINYVHRSYTNREWSTSRRSDIADRRSDRGAIDAGRAVKCLYK